jgi:hypothetical protein
VQSNHERLADLTDTRDGMAATSVARTTGN